LRRREYRTSGDKLLFEVDEDAFWGPSLRPRSVRRAALLSALGDGVPGASQHLADMQSITLKPTRSVVHLADGTTLDAGLIVGADGVRSSVRREVFGAEGGHAHALLAQASWRFIAPNPGVDCWTVWAASEGLVLLMPVGNGEVYGWAAITSSGRGATIPREFAELADHFPELVREVVQAMARPDLNSLAELADAFPARVRETILRVVSRPEELHHSPLEEVRLDRWHSDRVVLIGDAAHATAPVWAQGVAMGLEDALVLGALLSGTEEMPTVLSGFEAQRRPRVIHVQARTDAMSKAAKLPSYIRNLLLPVVGPRQYRRAYGPLKNSVWRG
jgi:2-polyprenyl-6-methoxyphenol hydroxylase-like FAD-dependent oxidoreductase